MIQIAEDSLKGQIAVITGASTGIGRATAKIFAHAGATVGLIAHSERDLEVATEEIAHHGGKVWSHLCDVTKEQDVRALMDEVKKRFGHLDILFCNAGINGVWAPITEIEESEWDKTLDTNLKGTFLTIKHAVPLMQDAGGSIIITASVNGTRMFSNTGATAYSCSKAGQVALAKMLALELAPKRIRVNVICPGTIKSKIEDSAERRNLASVKIPVEFPEGSVPLTHGEPGTSGQVAELVWFLASRASNHMTGSEIFIDGGQSLIRG
jgi:NAD(P)-dependent dehydrogenase (short-subunit alcohol dehydrogenase family)